MPTFCDRRRSLAIWLARRPPTHRSRSEAAADVAADAAPGASAGGDVAGGGAAAAGCGAAGSCTAVWYMSVRGWSGNRARFGSESPRRSSTKRVVKLKCFDLLATRMW